jgi:hypothetical protein
MTQYELQIAACLEQADEARQISEQCEREGELGHAELFRAEADALEQQAFSIIKGS